MLRIILIYGAIAGLIVGAPWIVAIYGYDPEGGMPENGAVIGYASMVLALTMVFLGVKHYRDKELGGVIKFLPALGVGLGISAVASLGWVVGWEIYLAVSGINFPNVYYDAIIADAQGSGATADRLAELAAEKQGFSEMYANPVIRMAITFIEMFPIGIAISLISAGLLRNSRFLPARAAA